MRFMVTARIPVEAGNTFVKNPTFGERIQEILASQKAEAAYFMSLNGQRTCVYFVDMPEAAKLPAIAEPWWLMVRADVELTPVMAAQDFAKAAPDIVAAVKKYS